MTDRAQVKIPIELLEQAERGNVLLFVGEGISASVLPSSTDLAAMLAERCDYPAGQPYTFPRVAGYYELTRNSRHGIVQLLRDRLGGPELRPTSGHHRIARLRPRLIISACYDRLIEQALRDVDVAFDAVVSNADVPYTNDQRTLLVWLWGTLDQLDSLVLTEDDRRHLLESRGNLSDLLRGELARRTWLFLGFDAADDWFRDLYDSVNRGLDRQQRGAFLVGAPLDSYSRAWWAKRGATIIDAAIEPFLDGLADELAARARPPATSPHPTVARAAPLPAQPYKLLDYYEAGDAAIYFGREREIIELSSLIHAHRLTLLYGASGVGKTSLLLAGAAPQLAQQDQPYETIYARALEDPALAIRRAVARRLPDAALPPEGALVDFLSAGARALGRPIVLILDQFEEFFIRLSPQFRAAFTTELGAICDARDVPIKVVLSLREDWLAAVNELERRIPEIFRNRLRVLPLTRAQASQAITGPAAQLGVRYEPTLAERLLDDLAGGASTEIMPPQLQLVCSALYRRLPAGERTITLASYTQLGGARGVLQQYLDDELARLGRDERALARATLAELVTSQGTKAVRTADELALALDAAPDTLAPVLERLIGARLLRAIEREDGAPSYELAHEYLIREIALEADAKTRKQAEELIRQEVENWQRFGTLLAADKLALINDVRAVLRLGPEAQELLLRSALEVGDEVAYWLGRVADPAQRAQVLADKARTRVAAVRLRTVGVLGTQDVPESVAPLLNMALRDPDYAVREAARASLAKLTIQRAMIVEPLQTATQSTAREERAAALRSLAWLPLREMPARLRRPVLATRLRLRTARVIQTSVATPLRRAVLITTGLLAAMVLLTALIAVNSYYIDVRPALIPGQPNDIIVQRGLPVLPGLSQTAVDTGVDVSQVALEQWNVVNERRLWGLWMLRGKRDYNQWGKDLAVTLQLENGVRMLWYLNHAEGMKWLLEAAGSTAPSSRRWSAQALGDLLTVQPEPIDPTILETLSRLLKDADPFVRTNAANTLLQVTDKPQGHATEIIAALLPLVKDSDPSVRGPAIRMLGQAAANPQVQAAEIITALLPLLKDADPFVQANAANALLDASANPQMQVPEFGRDLLPIPNDAYPSPQDLATRNAIQVAAASQEHAVGVVAALLPLLKDTDPFVRANAAGGLSRAVGIPQVQTTAVVAALLSLLKDTDPFVRANAADALSQATANPQTNVTQVIAGLLPLLKDSDVGVRAHVAGALGQAAANPQANLAMVVAALLPPLNDADSNVRIWAARGISQAATNPQVNIAELIAALLPLLKDADSSVRIEAANALDRVASSPQAHDADIVAVLLALLKDTDLMRSGVLSEHEELLGQAFGNRQVNGAEIIAALLPLLKNADSSVRVSAAHALGQIATNRHGTVTEVVAALLPLLKDAEASVRISAAGALGQAATNPQADGADIVAALLSLLKDTTLSVRGSTARALGQAAANRQAPAAEIVATLRPLVNDADPTMRSSATIALGQAAANPQANIADAVAALLPLLKDADLSGRISAAQALGQAATNPQANADEIVAALLPLLKGADSNMRSAAALALGQAAANPQVQIIEVAMLPPLLKGVDPGVRGGAATALLATYTQRSQTTADSIQSQLFATLIDPQNALARPIAARALFLMALRDREQAQHIRAYLDTDNFARSGAPLARLWSNKVLTMLDIADLAHSAQPLTAKQRKELLHRLELYGSTHFFGEDFTWAAQQASDWLNQPQAQPGATP